MKYTGQQKFIRMQYNCKIQSTKYFLIYKFLFKYFYATKNCAIY